MKFPALPILPAQWKKSNSIFRSVKQTLITLFFSVLFLPFSTTAQTTPDPIWTTYYGGSLADLITGTTVDAAGNIYICGYTASTAGVASGAGVHDNTHGGGTAYDAFVVKFSPAGLRLWGTYLGGPAGDQAYSIVTDGTSVYVSGETSSTSGIAFGTG